MVKKEQGQGRGEDSSTIKLPPPQSHRDRLQAVMEAHGFSPDQFKIQAVRRTDDGKGPKKLEYEIAWKLPQEEAERLIRLLTIKPFDPDKDTVTIGNSEVGLVSARELPEEHPAVRLWTGKERGKRSKPKSDVPDVT